MEIVRCYLTCFGFEEMLKLTITMPHDKVTRLNLRDVDPWYSLSQGVDAWPESNLDNDREPPRGGR